MKMSGGARSKMYSLFCLTENEFEIQISRQPHITFQKSPGKVPDALVQFKYTLCVISFKQQY